MNHYKIGFITKIAVFSLLLFVATACEEEFIPEIATQPAEIVVEGYIEAGDQALPPYVLLTRSLPFFSEINLDDLDDFYVHDAFVTVSDGEKTVQLEELCWGDFSPQEQEILRQLLNNLGVSFPENIPVDFCIYIDFDLEISPQTGKTYDLRIEVEGKTLTASTTIPEFIPLEYIKFENPSGEAADLHKELITFIKDPGYMANFYRYFTAVGSAPLQPPFSSVTDDRLFNGKEFEFPLSKAEPFGTEFDPAVYGYFVVGDSVTLKWSCIDREHFDFWNTLEFNRINQGPFSSYTRVDFNIQGGIGIWGGYASGIYKAVVTE